MKKSATLEVLSSLQRLIERLHGAETGLDVRAYLVGDVTARAIPGAQPGLVEQLFVRQSGDGLELALYLSPEVVAHLTSDDPSKRLHAGNLETFCIALEGVSHFVLVAARASAGRQVSALELEIQAEVDKFVAAWLLLAWQGQPLRSCARPLLRQLFESFVLREAVPVVERERYEVANRVAQRFCDRLASRFASDRDGSRIERAVHRFVRQDLAEKLRAA